MTNSSAAKIIFPTSPSERGYAFEEVLLSHFRRVTGTSVEHASSWLHSTDGTWFQVDGVLVDSHRRLLEAKFYRSPIRLAQIKPDRRLEAAAAFDCEELLLIALNGFQADVITWAQAAPLRVRLVSWSDFRREVLPSLQGTFSTLLDQLTLRADMAESVSPTNAKLYFETPLAAGSVKGFPEFAIYPDTVERWLRRLPRLVQWQGQLADGQFYYRNATETVQLLPRGESLLSLEEAWRIEDAFSGYAARTYKSVQETAQALKAWGGSAYLKALVKEVNAHQSSSKKTGKAGVRDSLNALTLLGLVDRQSTRGKPTLYKLTPLGWAYVRGTEPDDTIFARQLNEWLPFRYFRWAVETHGVPLDETSIMNWFRAQYVSYEPYARCLYNPNKVHGLRIWYRQLQSVLNQLPTPVVPPHLGIL